jgi:hypothetical protein
VAARDGVVMVMGMVVVGVGSSAAVEGKAEGACWCSSGVCCCGNSVLASGAWVGVVGAPVFGFAGCHRRAWVGQLDVVRRASQVSGAVDVVVVGVLRVFFGLRAGVVVGRFCGNLAGMACGSTASGG